MGIYPDGDHFKVATSKGKVSKIFHLDEIVGARAFALQGVIIRQFNAPLRKKRLLSTLPFQLDETLPYKEEDRLIFPQIRAKGATLFIGSHSKLDALCQEFDPTWVSSVPSALFRYVNKTYETPNEGLFYFKGESEAFVLEIESKRIHRFLQIPPGESKSRILAFFGKEDYQEIEDPYAIAHGLVLEAQCKDGSAVQFLSKKQRHPKMRQELRIKALCIGALLLIIGGLSVYLLESHLNHLNSRYEIGLKNLSEELSALNGKHTLFSMKKALKKQEMGKTLFEPPPKLTKLLSHLDTLCKDIEVMQLEVELEQYPSAKQMTLSYVMRVNMTFKAPSAMVAEHFHEVIMEGDAFIDPNKPQRWSRTNHGYETTFYLKS